MTSSASADSVLRSHGLLLQYPDNKASGHLGIASDPAPEMSGERARSLSDTRHTHIEAAYLAGSAGDFSSARLNLGYKRRKGSADRRAGLRPRPAPSNGDGDGHTAGSALPSRRSRRNRAQGHR